MADQVRKDAASKGARSPTGRRPRRRPPRPRVFEGVCEQIRRDLASGVLRPGDKLPPEREMAEQLGVGRGAIREALRTLETSGVLELRKGVAGGAFVRAMSAQGLATSIHDLVFVGHLPLNQLTEVRANLLGFAVELACKRGDSAEFDRVEANVELTEQLREGDDAEALLNAVNAFYELIAQAAHNQVLATFIASFSGVMWSIYQNLSGWLPAEAVSARRAIVRCLRDRDSAGAVNELRRHLEEMQAWVLSHAVGDFRENLAG